MIKMKKLAAIAAATVMAVSAMAVSASAQTVYTEYVSTTCGTYRGGLTINNYSDHKQVDAVTMVANGSFSSVGVVLFIFDGSTGQQIYYDDQTNYDAGLAGTGAVSGNLATVSTQSHHIATCGSSTWSRMLTLRG